MSQPTPGSRWRATTASHREWRIRVVKVRTRSIAFERLGGHAEPRRRWNWMLAEAFMQVFAPLGGEGA
jgi:hypothetical protein